MTNTNKTFIDFYYCYLAKSELYKIINLLRALIIKKHNIIM